MVVRFGRFAFDTVTGELTRDGVPVHLQQQPARLLSLLVERRGQLVTRDEIRRHLWADDVFVDFQRGLNFCVMQIRTALDDDAEAPMFIETLPRRGYRFVAAVEPRVPGRHGATRRRATVVSALAAALVIVGGAGGSRTPARASGVREPAPGSGSVRVAVLPFQDLGSAVGQLLGEGLTEEVIAEVGRVRPERLAVIGRTSVQRYAGRPTDLPQIARDLDVDYVLEGSIRRVGQRVRVTARLVRVDGESQVWAETYERATTDLLSLQRELARATAAGVGVALDAAGPSPPPVAAADPEALRLYLLGRRDRDRRTVEGLEEARRRFDEAIRLSPDFAAPHAALADTWLSLARRGKVRPTEALARAESEAQTAVRLDPASDEAYAALGLVAQYGRWDLPTARRHFERALALNPSNTMARQWYALLLSHLGHLPEAIEQAREAARADPLSPPVVYYLGVLYVEAGQIEKAADVARRLIEIDGENVLGPLLHGEVLAGLGRTDEALAELERARQLDPTAPLPLAVMAMVRIHAGRTHDARADYAALRELSGERPFINTLLAIVALTLGERDEAVGFYEQAVALHEFELIETRTSPCFEPLRRDPRFAAAQRRLAAQFTADPS